MSTKWEPKQRPAVTEVEDRLKSKSQLRRIAIQAPEELVAEVAKLRKENLSLKEMILKLTKEKKRPTRQVPEVLPVNPKDGEDN